jgi:hypothetical protein
MGYRISLPARTGNTRAEAQRGQPLPKMNWPQKNAKDHKENKHSKFLVMRSLHCNPSESRMVARIFFRAEGAESAEKKQERRSAMQSFSATSAPLRAPFPSGMVLVWACAPCQAVEGWFWNKMF